MDKIVFSSTAATYGEPEHIPILETDRTLPTTLMEKPSWQWKRCSTGRQTHIGLRYVSLRYFNACGADASGTIGEAHNPESHLIPLILQVPNGKREAISIYGTDYDTPDGTCIRDYIHVTDLAQAHILAVQYLQNGGESSIFNLGNGVGYSVREVIESCPQGDRHPIPAVKPRGVPAILHGWWLPAKRQRLCWAGNRYMTVWKKSLPVHGTGTSITPTAMLSKGNTA